MTQIRIVSTLLLFLASAETTSCFSRSTTITKQGAFVPSKNIMSLQTIVAGKQRNGLTMYFDDVSRSHHAKPWKPSSDNDANNGFQVNKSVLKNHQGSGGNEQNNATTTTTGHISRSDEKLDAVQRMILGFNAESASKLTQREVMEHVLVWSDKAGVVGNYFGDELYDSLLGITVCNGSTMIECLQQFWTYGVNQDFIDAYSNYPDSPLDWNMNKNKNATSEIDDLIQKYNTKHIQNAANLAANNAAAVRSEPERIHMCVFPNCPELYKYPKMFTFLASIEFSKQSCVVAFGEQFSVTMFHPKYKNSPKLFCPERHSPFPMVGLHVINKNNPGGNSRDVEDLMYNYNKFNDDESSSDDSSTRDDIDISSSSSDIPQIDTTNMDADTAADLLGKALAAKKAMERAKAAAAELRNKAAAAKTNEPKQDKEITSTKVQEEVAQTEKGNTDSGKSDGNNNISRSNKNTTIGFDTNNNIKDVVEDEDDEEEDDEDDNNMADMVIRDLDEQRRNLEVLFNSAAASTRYDEQQQQQQQPNNEVEKKDDDDLLSELKSDMMELEKKNKEQKDKPSSMFFLEPVTSATTPSNDENNNNENTEKNNLNLSSEEIEESNEKKMTPMSQSMLSTEEIISLCQTWIRNEKDNNNNALRYADTLQEDKWFVSEHKMAEKVYADIWAAIHELYHLGIQQNQNNKEANMMMSAMFVSKTFCAYNSQAFKAFAITVNAALKRILPLQQNSNGKHPVMFLEVFHPEYTGKKSSNSCHRRSPYPMIQICFKYPNKQTKQS